MAPLLFSLSLSLSLSPSASAPSLPRAPPPGSHRGQCPLAPSPGSAAGHASKSNASRPPATPRPRPRPATAPAPAPRWHAALSAAAGLYPAYVAGGASVAVARPEAFRWFVARAPGSYAATLGFIMLTMGLTLQIRDFAALLRDRPLAVRDRIRIPFSLHLISLRATRWFGWFDPARCVSCFIFCSDVPRSTPLCLRLAPSSAMRLGFPRPSQLDSSCWLAVLEELHPMCVFSENFVCLRSTIADASSVNGNFISGDIRIVMLSVFLLHFAGFFVGYAAAAIGGFKEKQRRAISIEVGMQNSSLGVVLATAHFSSPLVALPSALSAVIMNMMGTLGLIWQYISPSVSENETTDITTA